MYAGNSKRGGVNAVLGNAIQEVSMLMRGECDAMMYAQSAEDAKEHFERLLELAQILLKVDFNDFTFNRNRGIIIALDASQRLAYGLCAKYGIDLPPGTEPQEAWEALKEATGKGASDFYAESGNEGADKIRFNTASRKTFTKALGIAKALQKVKDQWRVTGMNRGQLKDWHPNAKLHVTDGGSTIALDKGDIVSLCKNPNDSLKGSQLLQFAVKNGGKKLDSYAGNHEFYIRNGFEPVSWCKWDDAYAPKGWKESGAKPEHIIFYKYTGKKSEYDTAEKFFESVPASRDYDTAYEERDKQL